MDKAIGGHVSEVVEVTGEEPDQAASEEPPSKSPRRFLNNRFSFIGKMFIKQLLFNLITVTLRN